MAPVSIRSIKICLSAFGLFLLTLLLFPVTALSKDVIEYRSTGEINWTEGLVSAKGHGVEPAKYQGSARGRLLALRAAKVDAYRNLAEITNGVRVTSEATIEGLIEKKRITKTRVTALIKGAEVVTETFDNGVATVSMRLKMGAQFMNTVMPREQFNRYISGDNQVTSAWINRVLSHLVGTAVASESNNELQINTVEEYRWSQQLYEWYDGNQPVELLPTLNNLIKNYEQGTEYSGVVIDARKVPEFEWATHISLVTPEGNKVFPNVNTDYGEISRNRLASFEYDYKKALKKSRVAKKPLQINAAHVYRKRNSDLVIAGTDLALLQQYASRKSNSLNQGRLIIVVSE